MPTKERLVLRRFQGRKLVEIERTERGSKSTWVPSNPEVVCYQISYGRFLEIKHTSSANPYWHGENYKMKEDDQVVSEASVWVMELAPHYGWIGAFLSKEDFIEMMRRNFHAEVLNLESTLGRAADLEPMEMMAVLQLHNETSKSVQEVVQELLPELDPVPLISYS